MSATVVLQEEETHVEKKDVSVLVEGSRELFLTKAFFIHIKKKKSRRLEKTRFLFSASHLLLTPQHQGRIIICLSCQESRRSGPAPSLF